MVDRPETYSQEQLRSYDLLWGWKDIMYGLAWLEQDLTGQTTTVVSGLAAAATSPTSLNINLAQGRIYELSAADSTAYGSLASDATLIMQQGNVAAQQVTLSTSALSSGQNQYALIQAAFAQVDNIPSDDPNGGIPYFWNSANPTQPLQGQGGSGQTIATRRQGTASITIIYGSPATTGSEVPPQPSSGSVPLYLIDLTYGQTQVTQEDILVAGPSVGTNVPDDYPYGPFLAGLLNSHHSGTTGQAPQIKLGSEVQGVLPNANQAAQNTRVITATTTQTLLSSDYAVMFNRSGSLPSSQTVNLPAVTQGSLEIFDIGQNFGPAAAVVFMPPSGYTFQNYPSATGFEAVKPGQWIKFQFIVDSTIIGIGST